MCFNQDLSLMGYINGLQCWSGGLSTDGFLRMNHLGLTVSRSSVEDLLKAFVKAHLPALSRELSLAERAFLGGDNVDHSIGVRDATMLQSTFAKCKTS